MTYQGSVGYGLTDKIDLFAGYGTATSADLKHPGAPPTAVAELGATGISVAAKYLIAMEGEALPVTVDCALQYKTKSITYNVKMGGVPVAPEQKMNGNQISLGLGVGKAFIPFIPYAALAYRKDTMEGKDASTQIDLSLGTMIGLSKTMAIFVEYTNQAITPNGGSAYNSSQLGASFGMDI